MASSSPSPRWSARLRSYWTRIHTPGLLRRGLPIVTATLLSRPLGYVRVALQAWLFGATAIIDAFVLAFSLPSMLQVVLLTGPLSGVLVPTLTAYKHDRPAFNRLFSGLFTLCLLAGITIAALTTWGAPWLMRIAGPGLTTDTQHTAALLFRLMLPMLVCQALLSVCKGALNAVEHYGAPEYAGVVFNLAMIITPLCLASRFGVVSLAIGASLGSFLQLAMQFPFLARHGIYYRPCLHIDITGHGLFRLAQGAFLSTLITPINVLIDRALASLLFPGAIAALNYAFLLFLLPASLCVVPLSTVLLTDLADLYHKHDVGQVRQRTLAALRLVILLTVPITLTAMLLAEPLTRLVYEYGRFHAADTLRTSQAVSAYLAGLPFYGAVHILHRAFYATHDTITPALVSLGALGLNILSDLILMHFFSHWGIALATTVVALATTITLYILFQKRCAQLARGQDDTDPGTLDRPTEVE